MGAEMAVIVAVDRKLVRELESRRAFSTSTAVPVNTGTFVRRRRLERLVRAGVVHEARAGHYWLDQPAWAAFAARRRVVIVVALGLFLAGLALWLATRR